MGRGRKPTPTAVKRLRGNPGKRALNDSAEAGFDAARPSVPAWLVGDGRKLWRELAGRLHDAGVLRYTDRMALAAVCDAYQRWRQLSDALDGASLVLETETGYTYIHPAVSAEQKARREFVRLATEFGLTPSSRTRLRVDGAPEAPGLADQLFAMIAGDAGDD